MKNALISAGVAVVVLVAGLAFFAPKPNVISNTLGAVSGPDINSPYLSVNGVTTWYATQGLQTATTTICAIKSPAATSTIIRGSLKLTTSTTTAYGVYFAKAANPYATTTALGAIVNAGANAQLTANASTSVSTYDPIFPPNYYFVVAMAGGTGNFSPTGNCQATFAQN